MRNIVEVIKSFSNLPKEYKLVLIRAFNTLFEAIAELDDIKVDKEEGKGLSENDFTDELKEKLDNIEPGATVQVPSDWEAISGVTRILNKPDLGVYPDSAEWDKNTKKIYFKHQGTILNPFTIDGTDFIKDGMIDEVKIENNKLIIIFNTDSGKERIEIPLSEIFNPDNYYTKNKTDELFVKKVEGKDLSSNDFTDELKEKLENLEEQIQSDWNQNNNTKVDYIKNRTHWKETNSIYNQLQYSDTERRLSVAKFVEIFRLASIAAQLRITDKIDFWEYNDSDAQAISFVRTPNGIMFTICMKYPNINEGVITVSYDDTDALDDTILNILFDESGTKYDINNNLDKLYPGERTYNFEDKGFVDTIYHKLDKKYLPDDIDTEVFTNVTSLPTTNIDTNTIYRLITNDGYELYHNPTGIEDEFILIGGDTVEGLTNDEIDELINE